MPTYEYRCPNLHVVTLVLPSDQRDDPVGSQCATCGELVKRRWTPFRVAAPFEGHFNLGTGSNTAQLSNVPVPIKTDNLIRMMP